jgi:hypothetical protein
MNNDHSVQDVYAEHAYALVNGGVLHGLKLYKPQNKPDWRPWKISSPDSQHHLVLFGITTDIPNSGWFKDCEKMVVLPLTTAQTAEMLEREGLDSALRLAETKHNFHALFPTAA